MKTCLICHNSIKKTAQLSNICHGCHGLLSHPDCSCEVCGVELQNNQKLCGQCQIKPPAYSSLSYACEYKHPVNQWIMSVKFGKNIVLTKLFAELLFKKAAKIDDDYQIMPVPLHQARLRSRGYNQAYEIAKELVKLTNRSINTSLKRIKNTAMQAELKLKQRAQNVNKAFAVKSGVKDKNILLIDDVMTSGNTINACAKALLKAGAKDIKVLVVARKSL